MYQYKILTQKDSFLSGKISPERLEDALNSYARQGWRVIAMTATSFPSFASKREELMIVMERQG